MRVPFDGRFQVTQVFGVNPQDYARFGMKGHNGIDYGLPSGTPVLAAESGQAFVRSDPPGFGNYVEVYGAEHKTLYAHLDHATVTSGQQVVEGQQIGFSDNTGNSSGPHLHFGVKPLKPDNNNGFFGAIDPQPLIDNQGGDEVISDENHVQALFRAFRGRPASPDEVKQYVGQAYSGLVEALDQGDERAALAQTLAIGQLAIRDQWDKQIYGLQAKVADLTAQGQAQGRALDLLHSQADATDKTLAALQGELKDTKTALEAAKATPAPQTPSSSTPSTPVAPVASVQPTTQAGWAAVFVTALKALLGLK